MRCKYCGSEADNSICDGCSERIRNSRKARSGINYRSPEPEMTFERFRSRIIATYGHRFNEIMDKEWRKYKEAKEVDPWTYDAYIRDVNKRKSPIKINA